MIQFSCTPPPSANRMYVRGRIKSKEYRAWLKEAGWQIKAQRINGLIVKGPIALAFTAPSNGRRDLDNHCKPLLDLLTGLSLIDGDRFKTVKRIVMEWHDQPAMLIRIESWQPGQSISEPSVSRRVARLGGDVSGSTPL